MSHKPALNFLVDPTPPPLVNVCPQLDQLASVPAATLPAPVSLVNKLMETISYLSSMPPPASPSAFHDGLLDIRPQLHRLASLTLDPLVLAPPAIAEPLTEVVSYLKQQGFSNSTSPFSLIPCVSSDLDHLLSTTPCQVRHKVQITHETTVNILYLYLTDTVIEYPVTTAQGKIKYLFRMHSDPDDWSYPLLNIAYLHAFSYVVEMGNLSLVQSSTAPAKAPRLGAERALQLAGSSPSRDIFKKTQAYLTEIHHFGSRRPESTPTRLSAVEQQNQELQDLENFRSQRGYQKEVDDCQDRILFGVTENGKEYLFCEHYNSKLNRDHFWDISISDGGYDVGYIEAVICEDDEEVDSLRTMPGSVYSEYILNMPEYILNILKVY
ncbi:hypothetical protein C8J57DRAFT_1227259 [Mycena rebaudengoi]|nr:hypothetical protein C8J57DRAFT_1227259 [Mycena rebaudengoi]